MFSLFLSYAETHTIFLKKQTNSRLVALCGAAFKLQFKSAKSSLACTASNVMHAMTCHQYPSGIYTSQRRIFKKTFMHEKELTNNRAILQVTQIEVDW